MRLFGPAPLSLEHRLPVDAALDDAFAPLRARSATVGPARVRAAVRWAPAEPRRLGRLALIQRVSELTVAAAICAFVFAGAVTDSGPGVPDATRDAATSQTWMLNGRLAYQPRIEPHPAFAHPIAGDVALNAAAARRRESDAATAVDLELPAH